MEIDYKVRISAGDYHNMKASCSISIQSNVFTSTTVPHIFLTFFSSRPRRNQAESTTTYLHRITSLCSLSYYMGCCRAYLVAIMACRLNCTRKYASPCSFPFDRSLQVQQPTQQR